ncbi:sensor domain-containing phosphodiesterase [Granulicella tundricola]|uniref:Diguanylate phosphodiesterase n=1 Tax=Granulicella tundricola (strain ATCC BAA-1859 / DSM 23138 / MP5ACTX9) TaxID=1198114 RepID=E8X798_GRATM|nr:EAL domain-containing protein [Granulicella tundricola]ADW71332.1 diguanylate phosphodiesterase [Granulicella tundricola MP5ACTX9]
MVIDASTVEEILDKDELVPCFQPLRELRTGRLTSFEVLARWAHPTRGLILPSNLIEVAEREGLLTRLTKQLLHKAFDTTKTLSPSITLAINVSPQQLRDVTLANQIAEIARRSEFSLDRLTIEITEDALIDNQRLAKTITQELKGLGCQLVLDDFGTGYSSLRHLHTLRFDGLKIDRCFIVDALESRESRKIVAAMIGLGQSLNMTTVAEGIESEEQASLLLYLGCDVGQGWLYGKPAPAISIPQVVASKPTPPKPSWALAADSADPRSLEMLPMQRVAQLQAIYDGSPIGLCFLSRDLRYVSVNRQFAVMNGTTACALIGLTVASVYPEWYPLYEPYLKRALAGEVLSKITVTRPARNTNEIAQDIEISYAPARDEGGEVIGICMAALDITDRQRSQVALQESEERFRMIVDLNPQAPFIMDPDGCITDFGVAFEELTGFSREEIMGRGFLEVVHPDDVARVSLVIAETISCGAAMDVEWRAQRHNGYHLWLRSRATPVFSLAGKLIHYCGSTENINHLKLLGAALKAAETILESVTAPHIK